MSYTGGGALRDGIEHSLPVASSSRLIRSRLLAAVA